MKYNNYKLSNFVTDDFFVSWVKSPDAESDFFWKKWLEKHPEKLDEVQRARDLISSFGFKNNYSPTKEEFIETLENVHQKRHSSRLKKDLLPSLKGFGKIAASIVFISSIIWTVSYSYNNAWNDVYENESSIVFTTKSTKKGQKLSLTLSDGTLVKLNSESSIKIPEKFGPEKREVFLKGEAFFKVTKDPSKPFKIYNENLITTVLGTSFNIKSYPKENTQRVAVATGKVSVVKVSPNQTKPDEETVLLPNHLWVYNKVTNENIVKKNTNISGELAWTNGLLMYNNENLEKILEDLERWYGVDFIISKNVDQTGKYTGKFDNKTLENVLQGLSFTTKSFQYRIEGKKVWLEK